MCQRERLNLNSVIMVKPKEYAKFLIRDKELIKESVNLKDQHQPNQASRAILVEKIQTRTGTRHRIAKVTALLIATLTVMSARTQSQDIQSLDAYLLFYSSFDDTTDVNLFGPDNDAGWIYTAESTRRTQVLMNNRCPEVSIAAGEGKLRDCLKFSDRSKQVLFYQASPNLVLPRKN